MKTLKEYRRLVSDHPHKWGQYDVNFSTTSPAPEYRCGRCFHFYCSLIAKRSVCEIFKGRGAERKVPSGGSCYFFTRDGEEFPRLEKLDTKTSEPPTKGEDNAVDSEGREEAHQEG